MQSHAGCAAGASKGRLVVAAPNLLIDAAAADDEAGGGSEVTRDSDDGSDEEAGMCRVRSKTSLARKPMRGEPVRRGRAAATLGADGGRSAEQLRLLSHLEDRRLEGAAKELVMRGILKCKFCGHLRSAECEGICSSMRHFAFRKGDVILQRGEEGGLFFVIQTGQLEVNSSGVVTGTLGAGDHFGEMSLLFNSPHHATITAKTAVGVWAVDGETFRTMLREYAEKHTLENLRLMQQVSMLDGLSSTQKSIVGAAAITETCASGSLVASTGEALNRLCIVKSGTLCEVIGSLSRFSEEDIVRELKTGDCFGEQYFRHAAPSTLQTNLVAKVTSELFWVPFAKLAEVLGTQDIVTHLETAYASSMLRKVPIVEFVMAQLREDLLSPAIILHSCSPGEKLGMLDVIISVASIVLVLEGEFSVDGHARGVLLRRGSWCQEDDLAELQKDFLSEATAHREEQVSARPRNLIAGPSGGRVAVLPVDALTELCFGQTAPATGQGRASAALSHLRKLFAIRRVPFLRSLGSDQINRLALLLTRSSGWKVGEVVFDQGEKGDRLYVIISGQVRVDASGVFVRELDKGVCFGEYALLFETARSAKITVTVAGTEFWSVTREVFEQLIDTQMREDLMKRARLHDWTVALGNFRHIRTIGAGSFGSVRLVEHVNTKVRYALKRVKKRDAEIPPEVDDECALLKAVSHPFLLQMVTTFQSATSIYILTELITGGQLYERLVEEPGGLGRRKAQFYIGSLALALEALHRASVIYRDLKPENVLLDGHGYVKLVDFGLAKMLTGVQKTYSIVGTCHYIAPEVIRGRGYGLEADFWSLGVLLYELVCAQLPFGDNAHSEEEVLLAVKEEPLKFPKNYTDDTGKKILEALLQKKPSQRLASWGKVKDHKYFKGSSARTDLFTKLLSRELRPPFVPESETYTDEAHLGSKVTLSDAEELFHD